ncbi:hypothetical protein RCH22_000944 [Cryobacterium psychrotolerans]|nr:hypothetical protein [Cryobacterium psychrotolerans]MEC5149222.1 hypothetical protein [Cryobacterium psychrotolerans]MEC5149303.1 hypothetical protein [Cryobacterium psychrotolerans]
MTHDEYMDEPGDVIEWTLRIDQLYKAEEARHNS